MIRLVEVTKRYPGEPVAAVDRLSLDVPAGQTCVLIGPSGCGKTTTMKMINRLIEPTSGLIEVGGRDVSRLDPVQLRRGIGYVIQQIGLFPHMTIAENVATVPKLLGWPVARTTERVDAMLALVGLPPEVYRQRYPRELSGGQRQRVGVARALAGDPPVMLMDEPFGAVDPITRARLQTEFLRILRSLQKTIVFVTHDVDEAIRMGHRIAILRDGRLVQQGTPDEILARPADAFVEEFVGADRALKRLHLVAVKDIMWSDVRAFTVERAAAALPAGPDDLGFRVVVDAAHRVVGYVPLDAPARRDGQPGDRVRAMPTVPSDATVKDALPLMLASERGAVVAIDAEGRAAGLLSLVQVQRLVTA